MDTQAQEIIGWMYQNYGQQFLRRWEYFSIETLTATWQRELAGFTQEELKRGVEQCRTRIYPPNLSEFRLLCRPFLSPEASFNEAVKGITARRASRQFDWTHPAIFYAAVRFGNELLGATYLQLKDQWIHEFSAQLEKGTWPEIPVTKIMDSSPEGTGETNEYAQESCRKLREFVARSSSVSNKTGWAARILKEPERRTPTILTMAKSALQTNSLLTPPPLV
ncbi:hypothetical protein [Pusillimonas sp.]|uniref:hypothetical protein n=1 Tax=Pusillimonas sp. TaxID=3040095 RepID=UPI0029BF1C2B|nr:hypothetical protein [Pusillimonas sp.]MDX3894392.1 hypothetical protein [Pusillimonas sp.]